MTKRTRAMVFEGFDAAKGTDAGFHVVMVGPDATPDDVQAFRDAYELGLAWAEAEAALPPSGHPNIGTFWHLCLTRDVDHPYYRAGAGEDDAVHRHGHSVESDWMDTPAAALRALAERLREAR